MLEDYRKYLLGIRNNLIQCGVEFPVSPCMEYRELFELGCSLDSLLWYYSVLEISGSEDRLKGFYLPLGNHFKDRMKRVFYEEFQTFLKDYNKLSVRSYLSNPKYKNLENISDIYSNAGENLVKLIDIGVEGSVSTETAESSVGRVEYVECGRYLEDYVEEIEAVEEVVEDRVEAVENEPRGSVERVSHGLYLEDYVEGDMEESEEESNDWLEDSEEVAEESDDWLEESEDVVEESDDWLEEEESETEDDLVEESESDWLEEYEPDSDWVEESEEEPESDWSEEEEPEEDWLEEETEDTEDWVEEPENDWSEEEEVEDDWVEEPEEEANSDWVEEDESDSDWLEEEESEEPEVEADSDWLEEEDSDWVEEPEEEAEEEADSDWIEEPENDWVEEEEIPVESSRVQPKSQGNGSPVGSQPKEKPKTYEKDISDYIQDFTNGLLTSGKRAIIKGLRKLDK